MRRKSKLTIATAQDVIKFKEQRAIYKKNILEAKQQAWTNFCQRSCDPFGKIKEIAFEDYHNQKIYSLIGQKEGIQTAETFYENLTSEIFGQSATPTSPQYYSPYIAPKFTYQELKSAIFSFQKNRAPGPDEIDHPILRQLFNKWVNVITDRTEGFV